MYKKFQLKNSMNVIFVESHKSPVVSVQLWVKNGSADELKGEEGLSHFIEHLVFKGTQKYKVGEIAKIVEGSGGELNAYTSFDQTVYYVTISKSYIHVALDVISEMLGRPLFDPKEIDNEREVVLEEIKRSFDDPQRMASRLLFSTIYKKHPYGIPVIGYDKVIKSVSTQKIIQFFNKRYTPKNMTLVVAGDFEAREVQKICKEKFETFDKRQFKKVVRKKDLPQKLARVSVDNKGFEDNMISFSWKIPKATHPDIPGLDLLSLIIGQGESSYLNQKMHVEKNVVNYISAGTFTPIDPGFLTIQSSIRLPQLEEFLFELKGCLQEILSHPCSNKELEKAIINFESEEHYSKETVGGLARKVGTYQFLFDDFKYFNTFIKQIRSYDTIQLFKLVRKYLKPETLNITAMVSRDEARVKKELNQFKKEYAKIYKETKPKSYKSESLKKSKVKIKKIPSFNKSGENQIEKMTLSNGVELIMRPNFDVPVVSLRSALLGGLRAENSGNYGVTELLARVWDRRTKSLSERELSYTTDSMASSLASFGGRNTIGLNMTALASYSEPMKDLFFEMLTEPSFEKEIIEREKQHMMEVVRKRQDNPAQMSFLYFMKILYGEAHPYSHDMYGEISDIEKLNMNHVKSYLQELLNVKNLKLCITGAFNKEIWKEQIVSATEKLSSSRPFNKNFSFQPPEQSIRKDYSTEKEQSHIIVGFPGLTFTNPQRHTLEVIQSILSGQGGRLFLELRDKASLAYSLSPIRMEGIDAGHFGVYIGCSPEKKEKAISMIKEELNKLTQDLVGQEELERSKKYIIGRHDIGLQKNSSVSASILFDHIYGVDFKETFSMAEIIGKITSQEVRDLSQKLFSQPETIVCVG